LRPITSQAWKRGNKKAHIPFSAREGEGEKKGGEEKEWLFSISSGISRRGKREW